MATQTLEISKLHATTEKLIRELEARDQKILQLEFKLSQRLDKNDDLEAERSKLTDSLLSTQKQLADKDAQIAALEAEILLYSVKKDSSNSESSMNAIVTKQHQLLSERNTEIDRLSLSLEREMHLNSARLAQVSILIFSH